MSSADYTIDWDRCVHLTGPIGEELVNRLAPSILSLRQRGTAPITVAINSFGGSVATIDTLYALLSGPDQLGHRARTITVVTNRAYSAAATFLTLGDYAVALPHSSILFHDVRYGEMEDVTPQSASLAARQLASANESLSLRLAHPVFRRLTWLYIDLRSTFEGTESTAIYPEFQKTFERCGVSPTEEVGIDLARLTSVMYANLTPQSQKLLRKAVMQLRNWKYAVGLAEAIPKFRNAAGAAGLLDGAKDLYDSYVKEDKETPPPFENWADGLQLLLTVLTVEIGHQKKNVGQVLDAAVAEFRVLESINDPSHMITATRLMLDHKHIFFTPKATAALTGDDKDARRAVLAKTQPYVKTMWHLCVLLCRELVTGEHILTPRDALMLGLVDEVPGDGIVETRRAFALKFEIENPKLPVRKVRRPSKKQT